VHAESYTETSSAQAFQDFLPPAVIILLISPFSPKIFLKKSPKGEEERFSLKFDFQRLFCNISLKFLGSRKITPFFFIASGSQVFSAPEKTIQIKNSKKANSYQAQAIGLRPCRAMDLS
jgi:hypothetical protein